MKADICVNLQMAAVLGNKNTMFPQRFLWKIKLIGLSTHHDHDDDQSGVEFGVGCKVMELWIHNDE